MNPRDWFFIPELAGHKFTQSRREIKRVWLVQATSKAASLDGMRVSALS
jgi:hypothetical protein